MAHIFEEDDKLIKENKVDTTSIDACERPKPANYAVRLVMFARLVYAMLSFCARKFPEKFETRVPGEIIMERTSYNTNNIHINIIYYNSIKNGGVNLF